MGDQALARAYRWLHLQASFPVEGDDAWEIPIVNYYYGTSFPVPSSVGAGKNMGWTEWTHTR